jgi:putative methyltransferase (TIGR04325 family)
MNTRQLLKRILPPLLVDFLRVRTISRRPAFTWAGVYPHLRDVPATGTYDTDGEVAKHVDWTRSAIESLRRGKKPFFPWHQALGLVAATAAAETGRVRVLDFGGAVGSGYVQLLATLPSNVTIEYHVVDFEKTCTAGQHLFPGEECIRFHSSLPGLNGLVDIVYVNSALQYLHDYEGLLRKLAGLGAPMLLLSRLATCGCPSFATRQINLPGVVLPYWFLNLEEVCRLLEAAGYKLIYHGLNNEEEVDQSNFPDTHRAGRMRDLLFVRPSSR